ncbi:hypothetical protein BGX27_000024 [Mortierella sp. AM989]|nr:hypothetical protein BGX27_000024 [Mortierella sp. AM989]
MSLALKINPVEIPELLHIIGCHLSTGDQKSCMLVSRTWYSLFSAYYWSHLYYNRLGVPNLGKYGHLVRWLTTYCVGHADVTFLAGSCHLVQRLELELDKTTFDTTFEILVGNMPHIQELTFSEPYLKLEHLVAITRLKRLRRLCFGDQKRYKGTVCDFKMLLNALQDCPTLTSLQFTYLVEDTYYIPPYYAPPRASNVAPTLPSPETAIGRLVQRLTNGSSIPSPSSKAKEPWRKFVPVIAAKTTKLQKELMQRQPDTSEVYSNLTKLHLKISTRAVNSQIRSLFKKSPYLQELYFNVGYLRDEIVGESLDAITDSCYQLQTLAIEGLRSRATISSSIHRFFTQHRPDLRHLKLKSCIDLDYVLDLIPSSTVKRLERICFESSIYSHPVFHRLMTRCSSLQYVTWIEVGKVGGPLPPLEERMEAFLEPWRCYETMRLIEQRNCVEDQGSYEAFLGRLAQMRRLVSLGASMDDIRRLIAFITKKRLGQHSEHSQEAEQVMMGVSAGQSLYCEKCYSKEKDTTLFVEDELAFESVQELTVATIDIAPLTRMLLSKQLNLTEIQRLLEIFPKLRKIRYQGSVFPLDQGAREYLSSLELRHISVIHTSQLLF